MELSVGGRPNRVTVMGLGLFGGGLGAARFWAGLGSSVTVTDLRGEDALAPSIKALKETPCRLVLGEHRMEDFVETDLVIVNPAVKPGNAYVEAARTAGVTIDTEIGTLLKLVRGTVYGVTGSNGKSTTTGMLGAILKRFSPHALVGGNLGGSLLEAVQTRTPTAPVVLELSSFQLYYLAAALRSPQVAVVTNLSPNHLDWHGSAEDYYEAKRTILRYQWPEDLAVLPAGDDRIARWAREVRCRVVWFGEEDPDTPHAAFYRNDHLIFRFAGRERAQIPADCIQVPGRHNRLNAAAAAAAAMGTGVGARFVEEGLAAFKGLPHRLERVAQRGGILYVNDSISTTPESALAAIEAVAEGPLVLILGGYDKGTPFVELGRRVAERCRGAVLMGETAPLLAEAIGDGCPVKHAENMEEAVASAAGLLPGGGTVVLSPACASYDQYTNFEERGACFRAAVTEDHGGAEA